MTFMESVHAILAILLPYLAILWIFRDAQRSHRDSRQALVAALDSSHEREGALTRALITAQNPDLGALMAQELAARDQSQPYPGGFVGA